MEKGFLKTSVTDGHTDFPREAIGPKVFRRKPITTCDFPRSGGGGVSRALVPIRIGACTSNNQYYSGP